MRRLALFVFVAVLVSPFQPAFSCQNAPHDGVYSVQLEGDGPKVVRNDTGETVVLEKRLAENLGEPTIQSVSNDNSQFRFDLKGAGSFPQEQPVNTAAVIDGHCFMVSSFSDRDANGARSLGGMIMGEKAARAVAKRLNVDLRMRKHPGHQLLVTYKPDNASYQVGEPITLTLSITNVGKEAVAFFDGGAQRGPRNNQFGFTAYLAGGKAVPDTGDPLNFGGIATLVTLQPGQVFSKQVRLDHWFQFSQSGAY